MSLMLKYIPDGSLQQYVILDEDKDLFWLIRKDGKRLFALSCYDCVRDHFAFIRRAAMNLHMGQVRYEANKIVK